MLSNYEMLADKKRVKAFQRAIFETVKKGDIVVDLGTGIGILAFFAVQAGAKRVYAIEQGDIIKIAGEIADKNGMSNKIIFLKGDSREISIPEKADLLISEIIGCFALDEGILELVSDAKERFLKEKGIIIPNSFKMWLAPLEAEEIYNQKVAFWEMPYGVNFSPAKERVINCTWSEEIKKTNFISKPKIINEVDLQKIENIEMNKVVTFSVERDSILHGFCGWFEAKLSKEVSLSTAPDEPLTHWRQLFFPVKEPIKLDKEDKITARVSTSKLGRSVVYNWFIDIESNGENIIRSNHSALLGLLSLSGTGLPRIRYGV